MAGRKPVLLTLLLIPAICFILWGNNKAMGIEKNNDEDKNNSKFYEVFYKLGDRGQHIKEVQTKLNKFGYGLIEDGFFGPAMRRAVIDFQWRHGLVADGVVRHSTMVNLLKDPTPNTMYKPKPKEVSEAEKYISDVEAYINGSGVASETDYYIYVDTGNFKVNVLKGKARDYKLIKSMLCTIGKPSTPTKKGKFKVQGKGSMFRVNSSRICKYYTQFYGDYLFHSVILDNKGNIVDGRLGKALSHGCIRLSIENAKFIYDNIPKGTAVWIE